MALGSKCKSNDFEQFKVSPGNTLILKSKVNLLRNIRKAKLGGQINTRWHFKIYRVGGRDLSHN